MSANRLAWLLALVPTLTLGGCRGSGISPGPPEPGDRTGSAGAGADKAADPVRERCRARITEVEATPSLPGAPEFDQRRAEILGRARGEPLVLVREPAAAPDQKRSRQGAFRRVTSLKRRHRGSPAKLRARMLREGYLYSADPVEALALVSRLALTDLFDEPEVLLHRGATIHLLTRSTGRRPDYRFAEGPRAGQAAKLLFGDRVAVTRPELDEPLHRDLKTAAWDHGFDRARIVHRTREALVADLRFGDTWARTLLAARGAALQLVCLDAPAPLRGAIAAWQRADAGRRQALGRLRRTVQAQVDERLPFDRPRGQDGVELDGQLRPEWRWAYRRGHRSFRFEERTYPVFDPDGRPMPPQMCVDLVLDSYERAAGTWFRRRGEQPERMIGALDFDAHGIVNRRGVLAFERFAEGHPQLFEHERFRPEDRIEFQHRARFFRFLVREADRFAPGDVVAIQGRKSDGLVHQHAILIGDTDPMTGFPYALADQMRVPRQRTWEAIMAEAPLRSLLFRVRPRAVVLLAGVPDP